MLDWTGDGIKDETGLMLEIQIFLDQYHGLPLKQLKIGAMLSDLVTILRQHQMMLPADMALLVKAFISLEGMGRELDPDFDIASEAMPMLEQSLRAHYTAGAFIKRGSRSLVELWTLLAGLPHDISRLLRAARHGKIEVHIEVTHLKHVGNQLDRAVNRMAAGIVVAALIIGSSIVMTVPGAPSLFGIPFFGLTGFLTASVGLLWLLLSIWRSNRADQD
jgi:ubiquinone biosynthesis protein